MWKTLWYSRFGCSDSDPPELTRANFLHGIQTLWGPHSGLDSSVEAAHVLGTMIGIDWLDSPFVASFGKDTEALTQRTYSVVRDLFCRICAKGPTILLLDDLQWAGAASLDMLSYLVTPQPDLPPLPLLIVCAVRPGLLRGHKDLNEIGEMINLQPMPISAEAVAKAFPTLVNVKPKTLLALATRADGNPYFLEEIVKSLLLAKVDLANDSKITDTLNRQLPESLHAILQARLDALSPEARWVALLASVIGRTFWVTALLAEARQASTTGLLNFDRSQLESKLNQGLAELVKNELAFSRAGSLFSGEQEYIFKHSLLRDVAYELVPHKYRRKYHMVVAHWLATHSGSDFLATVAEHLEKAGATDDSAKQYQQAAHYALARGASAEARWMFAHAHSLLAPDSPTNVLSGQSP
jgi:predicted ATPase